jgi:CDP-glucose 4,6-dehydratase
MSAKIEPQKRAIPDAAFWRGRNVLVTGHTGFMGGWLVTWLHRLGAYVSGLSLPPPTQPSFYDTVGVARLLSHEIIGDIGDLQIVVSAAKIATPEIVFHLAAQPLVRDAFVDPVRTFQTNVVGTINVLQSLRVSASTRAVLVVTSDKVYENREWYLEYRESDRLGGKEPYAASKACAELVVDCYRHAYLSRIGISAASIRAGNIIGGGDWAKDRLLPDIIRAFSRKAAVALRNPTAVRPWQHVIEPLRGYLLLAQNMILSPPGSFEDHKPVFWIAERCAAIWGGGAKWCVVSNDMIPEANQLGLTSAKASKSLGWIPILNLDAALEHTMTWYRSSLANVAMLDLTVEQIDGVCSQL